MFTVPFWTDDVTRSTDPRLKSRRQALQVGGLQALGLPLAGLLHAEAVANAAELNRQSRTKSCIFLFLYGGPSQLDTFDPKPGAPVEVRGEFQPIATSVPGTFLSEHLPQMSRLADRYSILRSIQHDNRSHNPASGWMLTGVDPETDIDLKMPPGPDDPPAIGSLAAKLAPCQTGLPSFVMLPARLYFDPGIYFRGQAAGWLGRRYDPLMIQQDPNSPSFQIDAFSQPEEISSERLLRRRDLFSALDRSLGNDQPVPASMTEFQQRALDLLLSDRGRRAFDLSQEPDRLRERYGRTMFGQGCLLARRLIEAGVRLVTVSDCTPAGLHEWDTHENNFSKLKGTLLPRLDQAFSALLQDLTERGLLDDTVVYLGGEFGRTPRVGQSTGSGADANGRDHWTNCFSGLMAGGLTQPGVVHGASDSIAAYPDRDRVKPEDVTATLLAAMGLDPKTIVYTTENQPKLSSNGDVIRTLIR
jgi:hypothetical protein